MFKKNNSGGIKTFTDAVRLIFNRHPNCTHIVKIQDDVVFKENWIDQLTKILEINSELDIGITSCFRFLSGNVKLNPIKEIQADELESGGAGGICMAISRNLCIKNPTLWNNNITQTYFMDHFWIDNCRKANMKICISNPGLCQHIGLESTIWSDDVIKDRLKNDHKYRALDPHRVDPSLYPPFIIGNSVKQMCESPITRELSIKPF